MIKRVLTGVFALSLGFGSAACSGDKEIDKAGTVDELVDSGFMDREQAQCAVDQLDAEFGDDNDVIGELTKEEPDLSAEDQAKVTEIVSGCMGLGLTTETTLAG